MKPSLPFTDDESEAANESWGANCGPHSIAAALNLSLDRVRELMPSFVAKGHTTPTMIANALTLAGVRYTLTKNLHTNALCDGINRIQWQGKWLKPGVPARVAYFYTHWVAAFNGFVLCTAVPSPELAWYPVAGWREGMLCVCESEKYDGWHVTHYYEFARPEGTP